MGTTRPRLLPGGRVTPDRGFLSQDRMAVRHATQVLDGNMDWHSHSSKEVPGWAPFGRPTPYGLLWSHVVRGTHSYTCIITDNAVDILEIAALTELFASRHDAPVAYGTRPIRYRLAQYGWAENLPTDVSVLEADAWRPERPWGGVENVLRAAREK